jgi:hypothetical protein
MERKIDRLLRLITESFRFLLRKQTLVEQSARSTERLVFRTGREIE